MLRALFSRILYPARYNLQTCGTVRCLVQTDVETDAERKIAEALASKIDATKIRIRDISGGCGAMYEVSVESEMFRGKRRVQQHRIISEALAEEVKAMHGIRIHTEVPS